LRKSLKNHVYEFFSSFKADFLKDLPIKVVVADQKINFFKNERSGSKIGLLEAFRIGLKLSDPEGTGRN